MPEKITVSSRDPLTAAEIADSYELYIIKTDESGLARSRKVTIEEAKNLFGEGGGSGGGGVALDEVNEWTATQYHQLQALTYGANISWDGESQQVAEITLTGDATLDSITNPRDGATYVLFVVQDGTGGHTLSFNNNYVHPPEVGLNPNAVTPMAFVARGGKFYGGGDYVVVADNIADDQIIEQHLDVSNTPTDGHVLSWNNTQSRFEWVAQSGGGGGVVDSVFGRTGPVVAVSGDYAASEVTNDSGVSGGTVAAALDALDSGKSNTSHSHSDATTGSSGFMSGSDKTKLDNVPADTNSELAAKADNADLTSHTGSVSNPHSVTASQVGLGNVDNTSDTDKPVSTAQQTALDAKANSADVLEKTNTTSFTPSADYHPATKKYVDDNAGGGSPYETIEDINANRTFADADSGRVGQVTADGLTLTLPTTDPSTGWTYTFYNDGTFTTSIDVNGKTLDGPDQIKKEGSTITLLHEGSGVYRAFGGDPQEDLVFAASDESTDLIAAAGAIFTYEFTEARTYKNVAATVNAAPVGLALEIDIQKNSVSIFSTVLSIDAGETSSLTAAAAAVLTATEWATGDRLSVHIDQIGSVTAGAGLKIRLY